MNKQELIDKYQQKLNELEKTKTYQKENNCEYLDGKIYSIKEILDDLKKLDEPKECEFDFIYTEETKYAFGSRIDVYKCSSCESITLGYKNNFCSNCGAKIRK